MCKVYGVDMQGVWCNLVVWCSQLVWYSHGVWCIHADVWHSQAICVARLYGVGMMLGVGME